MESFGADSLPDWLGQKDTTGSKTGEIVWASIFCFGMLLPISLPRSLVALRFTSLLSFAISIFIVMVIFTLSFRETKADGFEKHDFTERFKTAYDNSWTISVQGIFNSLPLIIFSYMYQPNIPAIYHELKSKNMMNMQKVLWIGTGIATVVYIVVGMFGYVTFAMNPKVDEIMDQ
jgi:amino acid permease